MRINKLKFSNLNSLKGEFEIDFTDPSITEDNIFAIIGKTGSGKSTILDAITLALFAKTARIEKITGTSNEIMNRDSGSCYSEVIFTNSNKEYSALFSQRKARNKKDGNLTRYTRELRNYSDNKLIASNKTFEIELMNLIHLTFDQFSRSVLLAQGDFNKFLIAKDDEKAKILEQITGTEIYSKIGMKIYEHHSIEKKKLEILDAQLESQNILTTDEKKDIENDIVMNSKKIIDVNFLKKSNADEIDYYSVKSKLDKKEISLSTQINSRDDNTQIYNANVIKVELDKKAKYPLELLGKIKADSKLKDSLFNNIDTLDKELLSIEDKIQLIKVDEAKNIAELKVIEDEEFKTIKIVKKVRPIDTEINMLSIKKEHLLGKINDLNDDLDNLNKNLSRIDLQSEKSKVLLKLSNEYLSKNISDKLLVDNFTEIVSNNNNLQTATSQKENLQEDLKRANLALDYEQQQENQLIKALDDTDLSIKNIKSSYSSDKTKSELDYELESLNERKSILERTSFILDTYLEDTRILNIKIKEFDEKGKLYNNKKTELEKLSLLYETLELALQRGNELLKLSAFASEVKDDEPCPLCGSINHPNPISIKENQLEKEKLDLQELKSAIDICNHDVISLDSENQIIKARKTQLETSIVKNSSILIETLGKNDDFKLAFNDMQTLNKNSVSDVKSKLEELKNIEKQITSLLTDKTTYEVNIKNSKKTIFNLQKSIKEISKKSSIEDDNLKNINAFFIEFDTFKNKSNKELEGIKGQFNNHQNIVENKLLELENLKTQKAKVESDIDIKKVANIETKTKLKESESRLSEFKSTRFSIFGEKDCDKELNVLSSLIKKKNDQLSSFIKQLNNEGNTKSIKHTKLKINKDNYEILKNSLFDDNDKFIILLAKNSFKTIDDLLASKLDINEITHYESFIREYENLCERIKAIEDDIKKDKKALNINKPTKSYDVCVENKIELDKQYDLLQQSKGNLQEKLDIDKKNVLRIGQIKSNRDKQYIKSDNWAKLNAAVGSSNGKIFRGLAQGITLDFLLNNSNNKLSNLTDRYALVRSATSTSTTLDIDVIDLYMNGITRSVTNLSGGEKFLVSLSLALGLCELVNSDNPSETLFLDEGFGSLDEETLDNALNTLMLLSEKENKLIGIISHVQKVKDAIAHKIVVEKNGNGSSSITGAGVKQIS